MSEWTERDISMLKRLFDSGKSLSFIAKQMKRSKNAIIGKLHRLGRYADKRRKIVLKPPIPKPTRHTPFQPPPTKSEPLVGSKYDPPVMVAREHGIEFFDLKPNHCRWPFGDSDFWFCGKPKIEGSSYCEYHRQRARPG